MSASRKLSVEAEAAIIAWYSQYQRVLDDLRKLGSIHAKAREHGVSLRTLHTIAKRGEYEIRRKCRVAGVGSAPAVKNQF